MFYLRRLFDLKLSPGHSPHYSLCKILYDITLPKSLYQVRRHGEVFRGLTPKSLLAPPKREMCPPQAKIVSQKKYRLGATGVYFESRYHQISVHHPRIREQELFFRRFCYKDLFFIFSLHPRVRENYRIFRDEDFCFLSLCRPKNYLGPPFQSSYSGAAPGLY